MTRTPFRISFFGGGSDFPGWYNQHGGGAVLSTSINKYCYITCRFLPPFFDHKSRIVWSKIENVQSHDQIEHPVVKETLRYLDIKNGVEIFHNADLPARSGLGSSSSFTVGLYHALSSLLGRVVTKRQLALTAIHIEQDRLKENVGCQDQAVAAFGGLNRIDFGGPQKVSVQPLTLLPDRIRALHSHLLLFFTGRSRYSSDIQKEHVLNMTHNTAHLTTLRDMVHEGVSILASEGDLARFGELLHEGWRLKKSLSSQVSTSEIDSIYDDARSAGALGGKLLGAGGGGFMLLFARPEHHLVIRERLKNLLYVPFLFEELGSQIIYHGPDEYTDYRRAYSSSS